jgi:hypothetical protein
MIIAFLILVLGIAAIVVCGCCAISGKLSREEEKNDTCFKS